jgi:hypothetical protein
VAAVARAAWFKKPRRSIDIPYISNTLKRPDNRKEILFSSSHSLINEIPILPVQGKFLGDLAATDLKPRKCHLISVLEKQPTGDGDQFATDPDVRN